MGNNFYRQIVGIPQGSILSTLLCWYVLKRIMRRLLICSINSIFYSHMENTHFDDLCLEENLLLRLVDDFLFITNDLNKAKSFISKMHKGSYFSID
jgi:telomerase reverse transcriptase